MSTISLKTLLDTMEAQPLTKPVTDAYFQNKYGDPYDSTIVQAAKLKTLSACAIGEAAIQLSHMAIGCLRGVHTDEVTNVVKGLAKCIEGTTEDFWWRAESYYSYYGSITNGSALGPRRHKLPMPTRTEAIRMAAEDFNVEI